MAWQHLAPQADASLGGARAEVRYSRFNVTNTQNLCYSVTLIVFNAMQAGEVWTRVHASIRMQNYSCAMRALRTYIMNHPNDYIAYDLRCLCALHCNDFSLALSDAIQCTTLNPSW